MKELTYYKKALLQKYYDGSCSDEEYEQVVKWLDNLEYDTELQFLLKKEWESVVDYPDLDIDIENQWQKWLNKANEEGALAKTPKANYVRFYTGTWVKWAAAVFFPLMVAYMLILFSSEKKSGNNTLSQEIEWVERETKKGQKLSLTLPDGTQVKLNSSSRISFQKSFLQGHTRIVRLDGEAFFEVTKMDGLPFIVKTKNLSTTVLGTAFGVNDYSHNKAQFVAVLEGKVKVENHDVSDESSNHVYLEMDQMASLESTGGKERLLRKSTFERDVILGWKDDRLVFQESSFKELITTLEEWYGVEFEFSGDIPEGKKFTGTFKGKSLSTVLEGIGFSSRFDYEIKERKVLVKVKP